MIDAFKFYYTASKLKDILREGAIQWNVNKQRKESVAEHIYGCLILAISLYYELNLNLDLKKVLFMLTIHELEEIFIGDITPLSKTKKADTKSALTEIDKMLGKAKCKTDVINLTNEYNSATSPEARFAKAVDKLECVLEFKKYQDLGLTSLDNLTTEMLKNKQLKDLVNTKKYDLADIFFIYHQAAYIDFGIDQDFWFNKLKNLNID